jgi:hypothetical protein
MAIQVNGCTVIDDDRNIVNAGDIRVGLVTITGSTGDIQTSGTITGAGYSVSGVGFTSFPANGATNVGPSTTTSIILSFPTSVTRGTGTVRLTIGSTNGTGIGTYNAATAPEITVLNNTWSLRTVPENYTGTNKDPILAFGQTIFLTIPSTAIQGFVGLNTTGASSYSFSTSGATLGQAFEGGFVICRAGGVNWIVSPIASQVSRNWYARANSNTVAQQVSGCTGWFVPTCSQLNNPGYTCRVYWDAYCNANYWSNTPNTIYSVNCVPIVNIATGPTGCNNAESINCVRSFRCVTY